jgi:ribosomal protein S18 acetylase RimI-like enzyme
MEIILAKNSDVPEIAEIWKEFMDFHKDIDPYFTRSEDGHSNFGKYVEDLIKAEDSQVLVALEQGRVVAYSIAQIAKPPPVFEHQTYGFISDVAVKSNYRRKGIGERLLVKIYEWFESNKISRIELRVAAKNEIGYSFWKKHGFRDFVHVLYLNR